MFLFIFAGRHQFLLLMDLEYIKIIQTSTLDYSCVLLKQFMRFIRRQYLSMCMQNALGPTRIWSQLPVRVDTVPKTWHITQWLTERLSLAGYGWGTLSQELLLHVVNHRLSNSILKMLIELTSELTVNYQAASMRLQAHRVGPCMLSQAPNTFQCQSVKMLAKLYFPSYTVQSHSHIFLILHCFTGFLLPHENVSFNKFMKI